jgi:hypothetical protein
VSVTACQGLQGDHVDDAPDLRPAAAELSRRYAEEFADTGPPLVGQCLAVHQDKRRGAVRGDDRARDHRLTGPGRGDQHAEVVTGQFMRRFLLPAGQGGGEGELLRVPDGPLVGDLESAACLLGQ